MATDGGSRLQQVAGLLVVVTLVLSVVVPWLLLVGLPAVPDLDSLRRAAELGVVLVVLALLVRQKRRARGKSPSEGAPERPEDRQIRERADRIAETDRETRERR